MAFLRNFISNQRFRFEKKEIFSCCVIIEQIFQIFQILTIVILHKQKNVC